MAVPGFDPPHWTSISLEEGQGLVERMTFDLQEWGDGLLLEASDLSPYKMDGLTTGNLIDVLLRLASEDGLDVRSGHETLDGFALDGQLFGWDFEDDDDGNRCVLIEFEGDEVAGA